MQRLIPEPNARAYHRPQKRNVLNRAMPTCLLTSSNTIAIGMIICHNGKRLRPQRYRQ